MPPIPDTSQMDPYSADGYEKGYACGYPDGSKARSEGNYPSPGDPLVGVAKSHSQCNVPLPKFYGQETVGGRTYTTDITLEVLPYWEKAFELGYRDGWVDGWKFTDPPAAEPEPAGAEVGAGPEEQIRIPGLKRPTATIQMPGGQLVEIPARLSPGPNAAPQQSPDGDGGAPVDADAPPASEDDKTLLVAAGVIVALALGAAIFS